MKEYSNMKQKKKIKLNLMAYLERFTSGNKRRTSLYICHFLAFLEIIILDLLQKIFFTKSLNSNVKFFMALSLTKPSVVVKWIEK